MGLLWATFMLAFTLFKAACQATLILYPSYKTYKALESGRRGNMQAAQGMLLYWCISAFVASGKEVVDEVLGTYSNFFLWKFTVFALRAAPLIIGPERMYRLIVKPLFDANEEQVDAAVERARAVKTIAKDAVPAAKEGDVDAVKEAAAEIVHTIQEQAAEVSHAIQAKAEQVGLTWDRKGVWQGLEQSMLGMEKVRDMGLRVAANRWQQHGPFVTTKAKEVTQKGTQLYATHAPVLKQQAISMYQQQVLPRVQPKVQALTDKYQQTVRPAVMSQVTKVQTVWEQKGGPIRTFYFQRALPLYQNQIRPFVVDSFLPALYETILALKDRLMDYFSPPSDEVRTQRAHHRRRRREEGESRASWKKRGDKVKSKWASSWREAEGDMNEAPAAASSEHVANHAIDSAATLTHRRGKHHREHSKVQETAAPSAPEPAPVEPSAPQSESTEQVWAVSKSAGIPHEEGLPVKPSSSSPSEKLGDLSSGVKESESGERSQEQWQGERSANLAEPIQ